MIYSLSLRTKISLATFVAILAIGLIVSHSLIIPTPGPLVVADQMGVDIGVFFIYGLLVAIPATLVGGVIYGKIIGKRIPNGNRLEDVKEELQTVEQAERGPNRKEMPTWLAYAMLALPIVLILSNTVVNNVILQDSSETILGKIFAVVGDKNSALLISVIVAMFVLKPYIKEKTEVVMKEAFESSGMVLLITGAGGAFGQVVQQTGLGDLLVNLMTGFNMPALILGFVFAQILRASLGSATVALVTTSTILGPLAADLGASPVLLGLAIAAGGIGLSLPNDSGFWVVNKFGRLSVTETIRIWS